MPSSMTPMATWWTCSPISPDPIFRFHATRSYHSLDQPQQLLYTTGELTPGGNQTLKLKQNGIFNLIGGGLFFLTAILTWISFNPTALFIAGCVIIGILMIATGFEKKQDS